MMYFSSLSIYSLKSQNGPYFDNLLNYVIQQYFNDSKIVFVIKF